MKKITTLLAIALIAVTSACKKPAGEGGDSSIKGKVWVKNYNADFTVFNGEYAGADENVFIIYGDDVSYGNKIAASPDGSFEFKYLRKGSYKIYVYSKDKTMSSPSGMITVMKDVEITDKKQKVDAGTFLIYN